MCNVHFVDYIQSEYSFNIESIQENFPFLIHSFAVTFTCYTLNELYKSHVPGLYIKTGNYTRRYTYASTI